MQFNFRVDVFVHADSPETTDKLNVLLSKVEQILDKENQIMATLDQVLQDVTDESTKLDSLAALIAGLKQQVADALAGVTLPPAVQAKVDAIFDAAEANKGKIQAALDANVTPTP